VAWDIAPETPITADDIKVAAPEAESELAVGFFGSRYERATPAERDYMRAMAQLGDEPVPTSSVADELGASLQPLPARDGLIKKGLFYSAERGLVAFTVPHFGKFLEPSPLTSPLQLSTSSSSTLDDDRKSHRPPPHKTLQFSVASLETRRFEYIVTLRFSTRSLGPRLDIEETHDSDPQVAEPQTWPCR